ncbi:putative ankyrin repeat protein RBE_0317 [Salvia hispanica]|uniref:putative ankyrin repeat protein RBE_0317 n=1 Tax=Salvia hispanica TaxID=49212 RepID=UPI002009B81B|nr:putative ankyrin repeat protein RBE_0317 [Salvia hispanica]
MYKEPDLYLAAINGDLDHFKRIFHQISTGDSEVILSRLSLTGNTFLHVAAKHGNQAIVKFIASTQPSLVLAKNFNGETALHLAAKGGDEAMVEALVGILSHNETEKRDLLMAQNEMGNTALHQALLCGRESIARFLIQQDSEPSYDHLNKHGESAIYLAAKAGLVGCVSSILVQCTDESSLNKLFKNKSPIQMLTSSAFCLKISLKQRHCSICLVDYQWMNVDMAADVAMLVVAVVVRDVEISQTKRLHDSVNCATLRMMI